MEEHTEIKNELLTLANQVSETFAYEAVVVNSCSTNKEIDNHDSDFKPPDLDWINLEAKLKEAQQEINIQNKRANFNSDRDEIRRKLAIVTSSASNHNHNHNNENIISDYLRKQTKNNYLGQNLQICFMNESGDDAVDSETVSTQSEYETNDDISTTTTTASNNNAKSNQIPCLMFSAFSFDPNDTCETFITQHLNLQNKTKLALKQVPIDVRKEIENEKNIIKQPSPIADIVGLATYGVKRLEREHIVDMNIGQLQVIANDLCNQIEKTNEKLKDMLIDRDDFYMQQDALLVDIEDITKRIQESAANFQKNVNSPKETNVKSFSENVTEKQQQQSNILTNTKTKFIQFGQLTNKLFRFNKKP